MGRTKQSASSKYYFQRWMVFNLATGQGSIPGCPDTTLQAWIREDNSALIELLYNPPIPPKPAVNASLASPSSASIFESQNRATTFRRLSADIIYLMFDHLTSYDDLLAFALTCSYVWDCGALSLKKAWIARHTAWQGVPIACLGNMSYSLPVAFNNTAFLAGLATMLGRPETEVAAWRRIQSSLGSPLTDGADGDSNVVADTLVRYDQVTGDNGFDWRVRLKRLLSHLWREEGNPESLLGGPEVSEELLRSAKAIRGGSAWVSSTLEDHMAVSTLSDQHVTTRSAAGSKRVLVLRNLTKHVYVRSGTLEMDSPPAMSLGQALMSKICWSSGVPTGFGRGEFKPNLPPGDWAGNGFDVMSLPNFKQECGEDLAGWSDETLIVRTLLRRFL